MTAASADFRHEVPDELRTVLTANPLLNDRWNSLTPLGRNEWICWMISPKTDETRNKHLQRLQDEVMGGKRRPCCWPGCPHRRESARKWFRE